MPYNKGNRLMRVKMVQHAVGQGGLFCGNLAAGDKPLRWVIDCGSNQPVALTREIISVASGMATPTLTSAMRLKRTHRQISIMSLKNGHRVW
jgi:hypothetical protein